MEDACQAALDHILYLKRMELPPGRRPAWDNMGLLTRLSQTEFVRSAMEEQADLSAFRERPTTRIYAGLFLMAFSYVIGWPAVTALGILAVRFHSPLLVVIGGPVTYGISHLVFLAGMYLAGAKYTKIFLRWATRKAMEKLMGNRLMMGTQSGVEKE